VTGGTWVFLVESGKIESSRTIVLKAVPVENEKGAATLVWSREQFTPASFVSSFGVVPGQNDKDRPSLEKTSSDLVNSVESFAMGYPHQVTGNGAARYVPMIVTNADLFVCKMDISEVDLVHGKLERGHGEFTAVPYVRFQKSFGTIFSDEAAHDWDQKTVLVVQAASLTTLLANWGVD